MSDAAFPSGFGDDAEPQLLRFVAGSAGLPPAAARVDSLFRGASASLEETELEHALRGLVDSAALISDAQGAALTLVGHGGPVVFRTGTGVLASPLARPGADRAPSDDPARMIVVALESDGETMGYLRVGPPRTAPAFRSEDERVVGSLATAMTLAVRNARLLAEVGAHEVLLDATARLFSAVVEVSSSTAVDALLDQIAEWVEPARVCALVREGEGSIRVLAYRGGDADAHPDAPTGVVTAPGSLADRVLDDGITRTAPERPAAEAEPGAIVVDGRAGPILAVQLGTRTHPDIVVLVARPPGDRGFTEPETRAADRLAGLVAAALDASRARDEGYRATARADRAAIARDLHDHVIQQLYAASLDLSGLAGKSATDEVQVLIDRNVLLIDSGIERIRAIMSVVSARSQSDSAHSIRHFVRELTVATSVLLPHPIEVELSGPVDLVVVGELHDEVTAVLRELVMNAVRHAEPQTVRLTLRIDASGLARPRTSELVVIVSDDGIGVPAHVTKSGLANLDARARRLGGAFTVRSTAGRTEAEWRIPLPVVLPERREVSS